MLRKLRLRNFKSISEQEYDFTQFDLLVGPNNSGKSTILQALAIWQFCVNEFSRHPKSGKSGIQVVLPNFTALPVPEFNLLWKDKTDRQYPIVNGRRHQEYILIGIEVVWGALGREEKSFAIDLRYHSPQTIYAIPREGWGHFKQFQSDEVLPRLAYVPPFSGLEPTEKWMDTSPIRQQVGKGQPGSVLRNLLLQVYNPSRQKLEHGHAPPAEWEDLVSAVRRWFSVTINPPAYETGRDVYITVEYEKNGKKFDIIAAGSGFHQTLTLLAFLYGYRPTTILMDEPDAHLHVNLQRQILDFFRDKSQDMGVQFLIATHAEEFVKGVDAPQIVSLINQVPRRVQSVPAILRAMSDVPNEEATRLMISPYLLYVEGEDDERVIRAWSEVLGVRKEIERFLFRTMNGGTKPLMKERNDKHFQALQCIVPGVRRQQLFDYDSADDAFHPDESNPSLYEWKRKNIENYLLVPDSWKRAALKAFGNESVDLISMPVINLIDDFFQGENLTLPVGRNWRDLNANVFKIVDGKRILFADDDSLFHRLRRSSPSVSITREIVAGSMTADEIHDDVHILFQRLLACLG